MTKQSSSGANLSKIATPRRGGARNDNNQPIQYVKGYVKFYKLKFKVTPDTLIPRPETELLVDEVLNWLRLHLGQGVTLQKPITILDLGTGAGNIAISLAKNISHPVTRFGYAPGMIIYATDISGKALKVARQNAKLHGVENQIQFIQSNLLKIVIASEAKQSSSVEDCHVGPDEFHSSRILDYNRDRRLPPRNDSGVDIIVTNLPYIPSARIPYLDSSVKDFEPHIALDGGEDGFKLYRNLFQQINNKGWKPKLIIGEIDYTHGELAALEAQKYFPEAEIEVKKDLAHLQRILLIRQLL